jgi:hypothetical protein
MHDCGDVQWTDKYHIMCAEQDVSGWVDRHQTRNELGGCDLLAVFLWSDHDTFL